MEPFEDRLSRFLRGSPAEYSETILNSIANFFLSEIRAARDAEAYKLVFLGTHAVIQTVTEKIVGIEKPIDGTRYYLEHFVDSTETDKQFSRISDDIHFLRNTTAHLWLSRRGHSLVYDSVMAEGWRQAGSELRINPLVYCQQFLDGFGLGGRIWQLRKQLDPEQARSQKYRFLCDWLELPRRDPIRQAVDAFVAASPSQRDSEEAAVRQLIKAQYHLP